MNTEIDPALAIEIAASNHQHAMNSVIDEGGSNIQRFYHGSIVFLTGGSGFLGKQLIEKLFRSCRLKRMYLLLRPKKRKSPQQRLHYILDDPVFESLLKKDPSFVKKLIAVEGDVTDIKLGISEEDQKAISKEVDIIFHLAAAMRLDESIRVATFTNVRGTREILNLAKQCKKLRSFVHVSTTYAHARASYVSRELLEKFYPCPVPPDVMIQFVETVDESKLEDITPNLVKDWPNTYTFTKAMAEEVVRVRTGDLPVCVVRPPVVASTYCEPVPGWLDMNCVYGISGAYIGAVLGVLHLLYIDKPYNKLPIIPVDIVNNTIIAAAWDTAERHLMCNHVIPVYTIGNSNTGIQWKFLKEIMDTERVIFASPKAVWYCYLAQTEFRFVYWVLAWLMHYIPAYFLDAVCFVMRRRPKGISSYIKMYNKIEELATAHDYLWKNEFFFKEDNVKVMIDRMSTADKLIYNCDISNIDLQEYIKVWGIGIRKYIIKDGLQKTAKGLMRQNIFKIANYVIFVTSIYILSCILRIIWIIVKYVLTL